MFMAMGTERSKALHNFTMPCGLRWGNQRFLRCMKVNSDGQISPLHRFNTANSSDHNHHHPIQQRRTTRDRDRHRERDKDSSFEFVHGSTKVGPTPPPASGGGRRFSDDGDDDGGIAATREKVMFDLQTAADKMKDAIFKDGLEEGEVTIPPPPPPPPPAAGSSEGETYCPWNLRTRRAACKMPSSGSVSGRSGGATTAGGGNDGGGGKGLRVDAPRPNSGFSQMRVAAAATSLKSPTNRIDGNGVAAVSGEKKERPKFSVALSKRDIEEDFYTMVGHRPPRRPKKRARIVQKQLDTIFPGLWLTEVTPDMYKVVESAP